ncbi:hypothetical protein NPIL_607571 [Nephila pilipes]|uniref:Uncharacterized protein n=1 Tax=Nephila pilipes TaxID=299642 RepID=A0A8X6I2R5_NEPPI|nr:hypothetical protein NPIL_607571 [Nephila pilipes]
MSSVLFPYMVYLNPYVQMELTILHNGSKIEDVITPEFSLLRRSAILSSATGLGGIRPDATASLVPSMQTQRDSYPETLSDHSVR